LFGGLLHGLFLVHGLAIRVRASPALAIHDLYL